MSWARASRPIDQRSRLTALGCRLGQGFLISHPLPAERIVGLLDKGNGQGPSVIGAA